MIVQVYSNTSKNAQEAHEAIRPSSVTKKPEDVKKYLNNDQYELYSLIWKRTVASQMNDAILDSVSVDSESSDSSLFTSTFFFCDDNLDETNGLIFSELDNS